ncbi:acyltransferase [Sphaerothrix gracilis]|uniref:acyltransferase n=1 Tax=Sphaerothrix gracilis TaxID=3151835 RepID=UPI0031FE2B8A
MVIAKQTQLPARQLYQTTSSQNLLCLDVLRCIAIIGVVGVHLIADLEISPVRFYPSSAGITSNLSALLTFSADSYSLQTAIIQLFQLGLKFGWQAVHVFLFISGFGLYLAFLKTSQPSSELGLQFWLRWLRRRFDRVLPKYWVVLTAIFVIKAGSAVIDALAGQEALSRPAILFTQYLMSLFLIRGLSQASFFALAGALWYIPLIIGLYLCFPILIYLLRRYQISLLALLLGTVLLSLNYRFIINIDPCATPVPFDVHAACQNPWDWNLHRLFSIHVPYGIFLARLPEFVLGMWFAQLQADGTLAQFLSCWQVRLKILLAGIVCWGLGNIASYYKASWPLCDCLLCLGLVAILLALFYGCEHSPVRHLEWIIKALSKVSYEIFLIHQVVFFLLARVFLADALGYANFSVLYLFVMLFAAGLLNYSCRSLTINSIPFASSLYAWTERRGVRLLKRYLNYRQSRIPSGV